MLLKLDNNDFECLQEVVCEVFDQTAICPEFIEMNSATCRVISYNTGGYGKMLTGVVTFGGHQTIIINNDIPDGMVKVY